MKKFPTESAAWTHLSWIWKTPKPYDLKKPAMHVMVADVKDETPAFGLCQSVARLGFYHLVDEKTYDKMQKRLHAYLNANHWLGGYMFGLDAGGAKSRMELCFVFSQESK